jgi:hypothetical protein
MRRARGGVWHFVLVLKYSLEEPVEGDIVKLRTVNERRGFPSMFTSLDYMHLVI